MTLLIFVNRFKKFIPEIGQQIIFCVSQNLVSDEMGLELLPHGLEPRRHRPADLHVHLAEQVP